MAFPLARTLSALPAASLQRSALLVTLALPLCLIHARSLAEAAVVIVALLFLVHSAQTREWGWLRAVWVRIGLLWWAWVAFCSVPVPGLGATGDFAFLQSLGMIRFLIFAAALETWVLAEAEARLWLRRVVAAAAAYILLACWFQTLFGVNFFGYGRAADGELTGPYDRPRAGGTLARILLPAMIPYGSALLARHRNLLAALLFSAGFGTVLLIGQRMPVIVAAFGLLIVAVLLPALRRVALVAVVAGAVLVAASPVVAPRAYHRLVDEFSQQIGHFGASHYGLIYARAVAMTVENPLTGLGFDAFRYRCFDPRYFVPSLDGRPDGGGAEICVIHAHNYYLQAATDAGFPGLILFTALVAAWLIAAWRGLWQHPDPLRASLFAVLAAELWPVAASNSFATMPMAGWFFLLLGWALAEARAALPAA
jgi:O-antigen ligase